MITFVDESQILNLVQTTNRSESRKSLDGTRDHGPVEWLTADSATSRLRSFLG